MTQSNLPDGVWPAIITPLTGDRSIDWKGLDALIEWYVESGVAGLLVLGQSSEMFKMSTEERLKLGEYIIGRVAGRLPVIAPGTFGGNVRAQVETIKQIADLGVEAVIVIASCIAEPGDADETWRQNLDTLLAGTNEIPLGLYECPDPYHRLIPAPTLAWAAQTERFYCLKDTTCRTGEIAAKIKAAAGTPLKFFNADTTSLLFSLEQGGSGYCGIAANFYPEPVVWLCANPTHPQAAAVQQQLAAVDMAIHRGYPVAAKYVRQQAGLKIETVSRVHNQYLTEQEKRSLDAIMAQMAHTLDGIAQPAAH